MPTAAGGHHDLKLPAFTQDPAHLPVWAHTRNCDPQLLTFSIMSHCIEVTSQPHPCLSMHTEGRWGPPLTPVTTTFCLQSLVSNSPRQGPGFSRVHSSLLRNLQGLRFPQSNLPQACYLLALALLQETPLFRSLWREPQGSARQDVGVLGSMDRCSESALPVVSQDCVKGDQV